MFPIRDDQPRFSTPYVTYFIIALNVLVFLFELSVSSQGPRALDALIFQFGVIPQHFEQALAGSPYLTIPGTFLTILTSMFLHAGWLHIIGNMWFLWIFGDNIEDYLGHFVYLIFYLLCGVVASLTHILLNPGVGLSWLLVSNTVFTRQRDYGCVCAPDVGWDSLLGARRRIYRWTDSDQSLSAAETD